MTAEACLEASSVFAVNNFKVTAGFRTREVEVLAGGPLKVEFFVENDNAKPLYLPVRGDRARLRQANFSFTATIAGREVNLEDPAAEIMDLGGLGSVAKIETGAPFHQTLLVNEFVRLENLVVVLSPGEVVMLHLQCQRPLPVALSMEQGPRGHAKPPVVNVMLAMRVKHDAAALEALIARLAVEIDANRTGPVSAKRELAIAELVALRSPMAAPYLRSLSDHPDPVVRMYVERAGVLANLNKDV